MLLFHRYAVWSFLMVHYCSIRMTTTSRTRISRFSCVTSLDGGSRNTRSSRRASGRQELVCRAPPSPRFFFGLLLTLLYRPHQGDCRSAKVGTALQGGDQEHRY